MEQPPAFSPPQIPLRRTRMGILKANARDRTAWHFAAASSPKQLYVYTHAESNRNY
jgi:hypothetical protein